MKRLTKKQAVCRDPLYGREELESPEFAFKTA
jgi:hypothetical protein